MGLRIVGPDAEGAVVHVVGNVFSLNEDSASMDSDDAMDMEFSPGVVNMEVLYGHNSSDDSDDSEDSKDSGDSDETSGSGGENEVTITLQAKKTKREKPKPPASEFKEGKLVLKKKQAGLPVITDRSGLKYQDILVGSGKRVVKGHNVALQYVLRLENGKVIDKADRKRPFKFRLGIGECVKGFDIGVSGMREGGERHLIVPPQLGYGDQSPPGIPRNATLYFDIIVVKAF